MNESFTVSFKKEVIQIVENRNIILQSPKRKLTFHCWDIGLEAALKSLAHTSNTLDQLRLLVIKNDGLEGLLKFNYYFQKFINLGWICHSVLPLATAIPIAEDYSFNYVDIDWQQQSFSLSRFAYFHQLEKQMVLESPLSKAKLILLDWRSAALISKLSEPQTCTSLISEIPNITEEIAQQFIQLLLATKMLSLEDNNSHLLQWEFHDLLFHNRSRVGRHDNPVGATYRFADKIKLLPVVKNQTSDKIIKLYKPDLENLAKKDTSLTQVLESRRSIRNHDTNAITIQQLGGLLYRCARIKEIIKHDMGEMSQRPYPAGGALYELEIYPVINSCDGLESGLYYYQPLEHNLYQISEVNNYVKILLKNACNSSGSDNLPQILLVITARFSRIFWKYQTMGYSLILKHVGVLYQTLYLVATAMKLAPCAIGSGDSDLFSKATGINYYEESSVGEFMLGSLKDN
ncbi:MAG: SagB family peptide dehydrogenase [Cyanobacteria bacterium J06633_8]